MTIFNKNKVDYTKEPLFFGEQLSVQRYDKFKYPAIDTLTQRMLSYFWRPEEVSLQKDRMDYQLLTPEQKHIFTKNLSYQILLDSCQARGPVAALLPIVSNPELEGAILAWDFFESIHSRSYTYIIKNLYSNPSEIFDDILDTQEIIERASSVTNEYDVMIDMVTRKSTGQEFSERELIEQLYKTLVAINILEGIRFYVSFACSFAFGELKLMEGNAKILGLIARDENLHLSLTQHLINILRQREGNLCRDVWDDMAFEGVFTKMYEEAANEEKRWAEFLFKDGSMIGLNAELLGKYVEFMVNRRMMAIGLPKLYPDVSTTNNPLPWTETWLGSKGIQVAPQETEISSYLISNIKQDIDDDKLKDIKL